jgi:hypothetical protein
MPQHQNERRVEYGDGVFQARDGVVIGEVSRNPADKKIAPAAIESVFRRDARIGATEDAGIGVLPTGQHLALVHEIVTP